MRGHSDAIEDYAKAIYSLGRRSDGAVSTNALAERLGVTPASVSAMLKKLSERELAEHVPYKGVRLTEQGELVALEVLRHHRLLELYLAEHLGVPWDRVHEEAEARARQGNRNTWVYQLDFEHAKHTDDIALSFGTVPDPNPAQAAMSATVMAAFVRFARKGDPGWAPYDLDRRATMVFDTQSRVVDDPRAWERELFARVPYIQPGS